MPILYVARSAKLSDWGSDVGLGKHLFKIGVADEPPAELLARGLAGETDWSVVKKQDAGTLTEEMVIERLNRREKMVDPSYYPRIKGAQGIYKLNPNSVTNHLLVSRAIAGESERLDIKLKVGDFAAYLLVHATKSEG